MIINPGVNASYLSENEVLKLKEGLGEIFSNQEIKCLLKYGLGNYKEGVSDIDLLCLTRKTVTDKKVLSEMGEEITELYESFGGGFNFRKKFPSIKRLPKGADPDLSVYDESTFSKYGLTTMDNYFCKLFESGKSEVLAGEYPKEIRFPEKIDKALTYLANNISTLRKFPLLKGVILRFKGEEGLKNVKYSNIVKMVDLPYAVFNYIEKGVPENREDAVEYLEGEFSNIYHGPLRLLLESKKSFGDKMRFLGSKESDNLLLAGITWYEQVVSELLFLHPPS